MKTTTEVFHSRISRNSPWDVVGWYSKERDYGAHLGVSVEIRNVDTGERRVCDGVLAVSGGAEPSLNLTVPGRG